MYLEEVQSLYNSRRWSNALGDAMPVAVANLYNNEIKIYTSNIEQPIIQIEPTVGKIDGKLKMAYLAIFGFEHYVIDSSSMKTPVLVHSSEEMYHSNESHDNIHATPRKYASYTSPLRKRKFRKRVADLPIFIQEILEKN